MSKSHCFRCAQRQSQMHKEEQHIRPTHYPVSSRRDQWWTWLESKSQIDLKGMIHDLGRSQYDLDGIHEISSSGLIAWSVEIMDCFWAIITLRYFGCKETEITIKKETRFFVSWGNGIFQNIFRNQAFTASFFLVF